MAKRKVARGRKKIAKYKRAKRSSFTFSAQTYKEFNAFCKKYDFSNKSAIMEGLVKSLLIEYPKYKFDEDNKIAIYYKEIPNEQ